MSKILKKQNIWSYFNGSSSYIQYADNDIFSFTDGVNDLPFEIEFDLIMTNSVGGYIMGKMDTTPQYEYACYISSLKMSFRLYTSPVATNSITVNTTAAVFTINQQYHVKITYDGSKLNTGFNIYIDNILKPLTYTSSGTYTGMVNTTAVTRIGSGNNTSFFGGYLRNLKIKKNGDLVFFTPLQDTLAVSKDVIGGHVHNAGVLPIVINKLESERWAYFNGTDSKITIGDTSTLGWMNIGVFNLQFEVILLSLTNNRTIFTSLLSANSHGILLRTNGTNMKVSVGNGSLYIIDTPISTGTIIGVKYSVVITGDGSKVYFTTYNPDGSVNLSGASSGVVPFVPAATTNAIPSFSHATIGYANNYIKNFKIFSDTAGTQSFLSLPFQNTDMIAIDTVGRLVGTNINVRLINNSENVMKAQNKWSYFDGTTYIQYADADVFSMTDGVNDLPFEVEFDLYSNNITTEQEFIKKGVTGNREWDIVIQNGSLRLFLSTPGSGTYIYAGTAITIKTLYCVKITYDGSKNVSGIKIFLNGISQTLTNYAGTTYAGMTNGVGGFYIGSFNGSINFLNGYLRNIRIKKNGQYIFNVPLQDTLSVSKDVVGGLVHNAGNLPIIVNHLEDERWAYFNGTSSVANIGTTSTLGWMTSGTWRISFDCKLLSYVTGNRPIYTATSGIGNGFMLYAQSPVGLMFYWQTVGVGSFYIPNMGITPGINCRVYVRADGSKLYFTTTNIDTGVVIMTNEPTGVDCTFNSVATTQYTLNFSTTHLSNIKLRNFKIFSDTVGTTPFLSLPFQNPDSIVVDTVGGLVGTNTNVRLINNNENVMKTRNLWCKIGSQPSNVGLINNIGNTSAFNFVHQTGIFQIEIEYYADTDTGAGAKYLVWNRSVSQTTYNGFHFNRSSGTNTSLYVNFTSGGAQILSTSFANVFIDGNIPYKLKFIGDGSGISLIKTVKGISTSYSRLNFTGNIVGSGNASANVSIGVSGGDFGTLMRNCKIWDSNGTLVTYLPLTDNINIGKDVVGGLQGGIAGTVSVIDRQEQMWALFNGTTSVANIGTTSTLGWMNSGIFNMSLDIKPLSFVVGDNPIYTAIGNTHRGFMLYTAGSSLNFYWYNGSGVNGYVQILTSTLGINLHIEVRGDGNNIRVILTNNDTGVQISDSGLVACTFNAFATTTYLLNFSTTYQSNCQLRNFKIFSDTDGTIPFLSLPMQNKDDLMIDRVGGLVGTQTDVKLITE